VPDGRLVAHDLMHATAYRTMLKASPESVDPRANNHMGFILVLIGFQSGFNKVLFVFLGILKGF
jgi:hypothetical protein